MKRTLQTHRNPPGVFEVAPLGGLFWVGLWPKWLRG